MYDNLIMKLQIIKFVETAKELLKLALPIIMGNIGIILIGAGDVYIAAKYSTDALAAISLANSMVGTIFMFGLGLMISISPILSNKRGAKKNAKKYFYPSIKFSMILATILTIVCMLIIPVVPHIGFENKLVKIIQEYIFVIAFSTFGAHLHIALKEFLQSFEIVFFPNFVTILGIFLNLGLNFIFVFGFAGIPAMGVIGLAIASVLVRMFMGISLLVYCLFLFKFKKYSDKNYYKSILKVGFPISCAIAIEVTAFNSIALLLGRVSSIYAAAQNIMFIVTSITFMLPLAISNAIAVKVGFSNGAKEINKIKRYSLSGIVISSLFMACCGCLFTIYPNSIVRIFTNDESLIRLVVPALYVAAAFQLFDGLQAVLGGIFKGLKNTKIVLIASFIGYFCVAVPLGAFLAFYYKLYLVGFWIGFVIASVSINTILIVILKKKINSIESTFY